MKHPMMTFMTDLEVETATQFKTPAKQSDALRREGITFISDRNGAPKLTWWQFNTRSPQSDVELNDNEPNFSGMK